jgi:hypothetical protein
MSVSVIVAARFRFENDFVACSQEPLPSKTPHLPCFWGVDGDEPRSDSLNLTNILFLRHILLSLPTILLLDRHNKT